MPQPYECWESLSSRNVSQYGNWQEPSRSLSGQWAFTGPDSRLTLPLFCDSPAVRIDHAVVGSDSFRFTSYILWY